VTTVKFMRDHVGDTASRKLVMMEGAMVPLSMNVRNVLLMRIEMTRDSVNVTKIGEKVTNGDALLIPVTVTHAARGVMVLPMQTAKNALIIHNIGGIITFAYVLTPLLWT